MKPFYILFYISPCLWNIEKDKDQCIEVRQGQSASVLKKYVCVCVCVGGDVSDLPCVSELK